MENTVAQKLEALSKLQSIDSELDEIEKIRGALPDEVMDLEDEIAGYETRVENHNQVIADLELSISNNKTSIKDSEKLIEKYKEQQMNVRNNREYDAITKEMELQELEIQIQEKRIKESQAKIESKNLEIEDTKNVLEERKKDLESKKQELEVISSESQEEEEKLIKNRTKAAKQIEERLLNSYNKLRNNLRNKLAVVPVERGACGGCFNVVPPQKQAEIRETKKLIVCEHCGRILSEVIEEEVEEVVKPKRTKRTKAV
ncbi:C4-type zinc ribbon domain-containing protein [Reichenbachiella sp. MALMAid0571]|uniref:zinc ribbon domain-containing protein n=1 Tax=Reichenbachiella sp. MALMAid0571 TaxID=3143939 RepID=UPI0032DFEBBB